MHAFYVYVQWVFTNLYIRAIKTPPLPRYRQSLSFQIAPLSPFAVSFYPQSAQSNFCRCRLVLQRIREVQFNPRWTCSQEKKNQLHQEEPPISYCSCHHRVVTAGNTILWISENMRLRLTFAFISLVSLNTTGTQRFLTKHSAENRWSFFFSMSWILKFDLVILSITGGSGVLPLVRLSPENVRSRRP